jgi:prepilin signal peptidase PulO-like enzyme (type II secretory pathway)
MNRCLELFLFSLFAVPITLIDIREYRIPDFLTLSGTAVIITLKLLWEDQTAFQLAAELCAGFGVFWLIWRLTNGQIGLGDAKFSAFIAVTTGFPGWFAALFVASLLGLLSAGVLIGILKVDRKVVIPFAPFLTVGAWSAIFLGSFFGLMPEFKM